jgi:hypothetical protein
MGRKSAYTLASIVALAIALGLALLAGLVLPKAQAPVFLVSAPGLLWVGWKRAEILRIQMRINRYLAAEDRRIEATMERFEGDREFRATLEPRPRQSRASS